MNQGLATNYLFFRCYSVPFKQHADVSEPLFSALLPFGYIVALLDQLQF